MKPLHQPFTGRSGVERARLAWEPALMVTKTTAANVRAPGTPRNLAIVIVGEASSAQVVATLQRIPDEVRVRVLAVLLTGPDWEVPRVPGLPAVELLPAASGYGARLKQAYASALALGAGVVATLHAAGEYPPELLPQMLSALDAGESDAVFGTRNVELLSAVEGGMPLYKFLGNRVLSTMENVMLRTPLSELHSGYRALSANALSAIPFEKNSDDWHFDTQVIIQLHAAQLRLGELPIGTYSSDEIGVVNGMRYAAQVARSVLSFKLHELGLHSAPEYEVRAAYAPKKSPLSSHARLLELLGPYPKRVLDVGSGYGELSIEMQARGHTVTAMDMFEPRVPLRDFIRADFSREIPIAPERRFDVIVLADVLEHLPEPAKVLNRLLAHLEPDGALLISLPNAVHWSLRAHVALGRFEYTNRGILDRGHLRFFTENTARRLLRDAGLVVTRHVTTPVPWENVSRRSRGSRALRALEIVDLALGKMRPNLFAYQHVFRVQRAGHGSLG